MWLRQWTIMPWPHTGSMDFTFLLSTMQVLCRQNPNNVSRCSHWSELEVCGLPCRKNMMLSWLITPGILFCVALRPILSLPSQSFPQVHCWWYTGALQGIPSPKIYETEHVLYPPPHTHTPTAFHVPNKVNRDCRTYKPINWNMFLLIKDLRGLKVIFPRTQNTLSSFGNCVRINWRAIMVSLKVRLSSASGKLLNIRASISYDWRHEQRRTNWRKRVAHQGLNRFDLCLVNVHYHQESVVAF